MPVLAQEEIPSLETTDITQASVNWLGGERYDPLRGTLNYLTQDIAISGNGDLPVEVLRQFTQTATSRTGEGEMGAMSLTVPMLRYTAKNGVSKRCDQIRITAHRQISDTDEVNEARNTRNLTSPLVFTDGSNTISFYERGVGDPGDTRFVNLPARFRFVSPENWVISCSGDQFTVHKPDGVKYVLLDHSDATQNNLDGIFRLQRIEDTHGNWVSYQYSDLRNPASPDHRKLTSITASDGRKVTIDWERFGTPFKFRVKRIRTNSSPNPQEVVYDYDTSKRTLTVTKNQIATTVYTFAIGFRSIKSIRYPQGGVVSYEYNFDNNAHWLRPRYDRYYLLNSRKTNDGGHFKFSYHEVPGSGLNARRFFSRLIDTGQTTLEYRYDLYSRGSEVYSSFSRHPVYASSGKLILFKNHGRSGINWSAGLTAPIETRTEYTVHSDVAPQLTRSDSRLVVPTSETTVLPGGITGGSRFQISYVYDDYGLAQRITRFRPFGQWQGQAAPSIVEEYTYDSGEYKYGHWFVGQLRSVKRGSKSVLERTYKPNGRVNTEKTSYRFRSYAYHLDGSLKSWSDPDGSKHEFSDYRRGIAQQETDPNGRLLSRVVNDDGTIASETRYGDTARTRYTYDSLRRLATVQPADSRRETIRYTWSASMRQLTENTSSFRRYRKETYLDQFGRVVGHGTLDLLDSRWTSTLRTYDKQGRLEFVSLPGGSNPQYLSDTQVHSPNGSVAGTEYEYDGLNRVVKVTERTSDNRRETRMDYNLSLNGDLMVTTTDPNNHSQRTIYVSWGTPGYNHAVYSVDANGIESRWHYDDSGNVRKHEQAGAVTTYEYDGRNRLRTLKRPEDGKTVYSWHTDGLLKSTQRTGTTVVYRYARDNQLLTERHTGSGVSGLSVSRSYNRHGDLESIQSAIDGAAAQSSMVTYDYDRGGDVTGESISIGQRTFKTEYDRNGIGAVQRVKLPSGRTYWLAPNAFGNPTAIRETSGGKVIYNAITYHPDQTLKKLTRANHSVERRLDTHLRPQRILLRQRGNNRSDLVGERVYSYDSVSNVVRIDDNVSQRYQTFNYDQGNRLKEQYGGDNGDRRFRYNAYGDIDRLFADGFWRKYTYDASNRRLTSIDAARSGRSQERRFLYDPRGDMVSWASDFKANPSIAPTQNRLTRDAAGRLTRVGNKGMVYTYDGRGMRVMQQRGSDAIFSVYDGNEQLIYKLDVGTAVASEYFYAGGVMIARRDRGPNGQTEPAVPETPDPEAKPVVPTPGTPTGGGVALGVDFRWTEVPGATRYAIEVQHEGATRAYNDKIWVNSACSGGTCRFVKSDAAQVGSNRWRLWARNSNGRSAWSAWTSFTVGGGASAAPAIPTPGTPAGSAVALGTDYRWAPVAGASRYSIQVQHGGLTTAFDEAIQANSACTPDECRFIKADAAKAGANQWRLRAGNTAGFSEWSPWRQFSVGNGQADVAPATPLPLYPGGRINESTPQYEWDAVPGAVAYSIEVRTAGGEVRIFQKVTAKSGKCLNTGDRCKWRKDSAPVTGSNRLRLRSFSAGGKVSAWSDYKVFEVK